MELYTFAHYCSRLNSAPVASVREVNLDSSVNEAGRGNSIFCLSSMQSAPGLRGPDANEQPQTHLDSSGAASADLRLNPNWETDAMKEEQNPPWTSFCHSLRGHHLLPSIMAPCFFWYPSHMSGAAWFGRLS